MESYPKEYLDRCIPLYVLSGVDAPDDVIRQDHSLQRNGSRVGADQPTATDARSHELLKAFLDLDAQIEHASPVPERSRVPAVTFRVTKAKYTLPARKASPQASPPEPGPETMSPMSPATSTLHSPLSPLSSGSPLFSDGVMTPMWNAKYQSMVPAVFMSFFTISSDPGNDSLRDNQLKSEIAAVRQTVSDSRYRTRFVVVIVGSDMLDSPQEVEERLINIRVGGRVDDRSLFYLPASVHSSDLRSFAADVLSSLRPMSTEFYRDLTKHSRRKRDRGVNPAPPPQAGKVYSNGITRAGWVSRYEYKLGIFAEYRGEPDVAERHYIASMSALFEPHGPFENTSSWSPRFSEIRTFADTTFTRLIRCQLLTSNPTSAARSWLRHRYTMRELVERKGKGSQNYGWEAWESRWPRVMAELVHEARIPFPKTAPFAPVENFVQQELQQLQIALTPWENLHHAGYWLQLAAIYAARRLRLASEIPEADRIPPGQSPASSVARINNTYDTYLALDPHLEWQTAQEPAGQHVQDIVSCLGQAIRDFTEHSQARQADQLRVDFCQRLIRMGKHDDATSTLNSMWKASLWRNEHWAELLQLLCHALYESSSMSKDFGGQIGSLWELYNDALKPIPGFTYDIHATMRDWKTTSDEEDPAIEVDLDAKKLVSFLQVHVNFATHEARAGEPLGIQLVVKSDAHATSAPVRLEQLNVRFDGAVPGFELTNDQTMSDSTSSSSEPEIETISFGNQRASLGAPMTAKSNLWILPGQRRIFNLELVASEAGTVSASSATAVLHEEGATVKFTQALTSGVTKQQWWIRDRSGHIRPSHTKHRISAPVVTVKVLPRPPKMDIGMQDLRRVCYTDERNTATLHLLNKEDEEADVRVQIMAVSDGEKSPFLSWYNDGGERSESQEGHIDFEIGSMAPGASFDKRFEIHSEVGQTELMIEAQVTYTLPSKPDVQTKKNTSVEIVIIQPFEATHHIQPEYHDTTWPSYFSLDNQAGQDENTEDDVSLKKATGIIYRYLSQIQLVSFATDKLLVESIHFGLENMSTNAVVTSTNLDGADKGFEVPANAIKTLKVFLDVQKADLDERKAITADPTLSITWRRSDAQPSANVLSKMMLPALSVGSSEPRVLARQLKTDETRFLQVEYVLENPSAHFLTFNYKMEASEEFAFSGPQLSTVQLTPLSRQSINFVLMPFEPEKYVRVQFKVIDAYFNKTLAVLPTGDIKDDGDGLMMRHSSMDEQKPR